METATRRRCSFSSITFSSSASQARQVGDAQRPSPGCGSWEPRSVPCVAARALAGGKAGGGEREGGKGRSAAPAPALLSYCATASAPRPGSTPQRALRTCRWPRGQSWTSGSLPHRTPPPPRAGESQRTVTTRAERTPDAPGQHRPHVAVIPEASLPSTPSPFLPRVYPVLPQPFTAECPQVPTVVLSHPIHFSITPPPAPNYRHPSEGKGPDVRPAAKGKGG